MSNHPLIYCHFEFRDLRISVKLKFWDQTRVNGALSQGLVWIWQLCTSWVCQTIIGLNTTTYLTAHLSCGDFCFWFPPLAARGFCLIFFFLPPPPNDLNSCFLALLLIFFLSMLASLGLCSSKFSRIWSIDWPRPVKNLAPSARRSSSGFSWKKTGLVFSRTHIKLCLGKSNCIFLFSGPRL